MTSSVTNDASDHTLKNLTSEVQSLREVKIQRIKKVRILAHIFHIVKNQFYFLIFQVISASKSCNCTTRDVEFDGYTT